MNTTNPVLVDPGPYRSTEITIGGVAPLVDQFDAAIFQVSQAMAAALALYWERQHGR